MTSHQPKHSTIRSIAEHVQVSPTTVSLALRGDSSIPEETRNRILLAARELNYTYVSRKKNGHGNDRHRHFVYVVKDYGDQPIAANPFYGQILSGVEQTCQEQNVKLGFVVLPPDFPNEAELPKALTQDVDGIIMSSPYPLNIVHRIAKASGCPIVLVDNMFPAFPYDTIMVDDFGGAYQITQHLLKLGHTQIKLIMGLALSLEMPPSFRERYRGYCVAFEDAGVVPLAPAIVPAELDNLHTQHKNELYREWLATLRDSEPALTAFFGANDLYAIMTIQALQRSGFQVPEDYSVVGFDDQTMSSLVNPPLTTIHAHTRILGVMAAKQLLTRLSGETMPPVHITVGADLILRASTAIIAQGRGERVDQRAKSAGF